MAKEDEFLIRLLLRFPLYLLRAAKKYRSLVNSIEVLATKPLYLIFNNAPFKIERACLLLYLLHLSFTVSFRACALQFEDTASVSYEVLEEDEITVGCSTTEPAYYTALSFHHPTVPSFFLSPNGKTITQEGQRFVLRNVTQPNSWNYSCLAKDKELRNAEIQVAKVIVKSRRYRKRELQLVCGFGFFCLFVCLFCFVLLFLSQPSNQPRSHGFPPAESPWNEVAIKFPQRRASQLAFSHP